MSAARNGGAAPDDPRELRAEIVNTREQLGAAVAQLAAKVDLPSRARSKAAELAGRVKISATPVLEAVPGPVRQAAAKVPGSTRQRRVALAAGAGVLIVVSLAVWRWRRQ